MFLLNNNPLPTDTPFTVNGIQYPANWLRLTSAEEKAAIGITEVADPVRADDRFYWNGDVTNPRPLETLKDQFSAQVKDTAKVLFGGHGRHGRSQGEPASVRIHTKHCAAC